MMPRGDRKRGALCVSGIPSYVSHTSNRHRDTWSLTKAPVILDHLLPSPVPDIPSYTSVNGSALLYFM